MQHHETTMQLYTASGAEGRHGIPARTFMTTTVLERPHRSRRREKLGKGTSYWMLDRC